MRLLITLRLLLPMVFVCLLQTPGWGAAVVDACLQEENSLRLAEAEACSGMNYIFNPNACFITRKELTPYDKGKCREIAGREVVAEQTVAPVKPAVVTPPAQPATVTYVAAGVAGQPQLIKVMSVEATTVTVAIEQLRSEISELKEALWRLKQEIAGLNCLQQ